MSLQTKTTSLIIALLTMSVCGAQAQSDTTKSVYNESVVVVGNYSPVLDGVTEKVNVAPATNDNVAADLQPKFTYGITPHRMTSLNTSTSGIRAAKVTGSSSRLYNNYLRFGLGHDFAAVRDLKPLIDLYYTSTRHDDHAYGARFYHRTNASTFGKADDTQPSSDHYGRNRHSETTMDLFGKYILNGKHCFAADLIYERDYNRYYGFNDSTLNAVMALTRDDISHSDYAMGYNNITLNLGAQSLNTDINKLGYEANVALGALLGRYDLAQKTLGLEGDIHYGFPMFRQYKAVAYLHADWTGYSNSSASPLVATYPLGYTIPAGTDSSQLSGKRHLLNVNPYVDFLFRDFKIHAGFTLASDAFSDTNKSPISIFPDLSVTKKLMNDALSLSIGMNGNYIAQDWNAIRLANPFVGPSADMHATKNTSLYAQMRLNFSKKLMLNAGIASRVVKNALFFMPDASYSLGNVYKAYYKDNNELLLNADFTFVNDEMISMTLGGEYDLLYNVSNSDGDIPLLYAPNFTAHFDTRVNYKDKWHFTLQALLVGAMDANFAKNSATGLYEITETLPARFGLALGAEYIHSRALSFFLHLDNITGKRYFLWVHYPAERFNAMLGLTYTIPTKKK